VKDPERHPDEVQEVDLEGVLNHSAEPLMALMMRVREMFLARENEAMAKDKGLDRVNPHG
jgi:hypothetical protein